MTAPTAIKLSDYKKCPYAVKSLDLHFDLHEDYAEVTSTMDIEHLQANDLAPLQLQGDELELISIKLDGEEVSSDGYQLQQDGLTLYPTDNKFKLEIVNRIKPQLNTQLEGLYKSNGMFCTQCEAEGFRRITYYLDRPDVMTIFTTTIEADASKYPILLSNGNPVAQGQKTNGRHWATWHDPFKKPCYLFALVAGDLGFIEDEFITCSGRKVALRIFTDKGQQEKCRHAMEAIKKSMKWDEDTYGREYDLDIFMVVAVGDFNMGAMENKGLNIFNTKYILADKATATDQDFQAINEVVGHEYFHNWSGNRVTCRDWFQLSLKEGLTIFRDQSFGADLTSQGVKRIDDVSFLRSYQFPEDAGPMAHPIRPESYIEMNNFYTTTVYNKGAEVIRMMKTLLGPERFRRSMDLYFERHDGEAVTCDDFVQAMEDGSGVDLTDLRLWYRQAGTPRVKVTDHYDQEKKQYTLTIEQSCPDTPGQKNKLPMLIPIKFALLDDAGEELATGMDDNILQLKQSKQQFKFDNIAGKPTPSLLREFSAPVILQYDFTQQQLQHLMSHDQDPFNRWEAGQKWMQNLLLSFVVHWSENSMPTIEPDIIDTFRRILHDESIDHGFKARLLTLPDEVYLGEQMAVIDVDGIHQSRKYLKSQLGEQLRSDFLHWYGQVQQFVNYEIDNESVAKRSLRNTCLNFLTAGGSSAMLHLAAEQYHSSNNMTDIMAALTVLSHFSGAQREQVLNDFAEQWSHEALVMDKWFSVQARSDLPNIIDHVKQLMQRQDFVMTNPNRVRSLIGAFAMGNIVHFHHSSGAGYEFLTEQVLQLDKINSQIAARLYGPMTHWRRFDKHRQQLMQQQLQRVAKEKDLSKDLYEIVTRSLQ